MLLFSITYDDDEDILAGVNKMSTILISYI